MTSEPQTETIEKTWPDYRAVWRWHFYASLFCIPFVVILSISGAIYLFKDEVESWQDRPYDNLVVQGKPATAAAQIRAALAAVPEATLDGYEIPKSDHAAARVLVRDGNGAVLREYVHPATLQVLHTVAEDERLMSVVEKIHGELSSGDRGSMVVELAASWTIMMVITGLFLWWPRHAQGLAGVLYPAAQPAAGGCSGADLHGVTGCRISTFVLFLLLTGLPWAKSWGNYFKAMRRLTGTAVARQDWTTGSQTAAGEGDSGWHSGRHSSSGRPRAARERRGISQPSIGSWPPCDPWTCRRPSVIAPPGRGTSNWTAKSLTANRPLRVDLVVDGKTAKIVSRQDSRNRHLLDRVVGIGIAAHEGRLFGWANQALGLLTAMGLDLMCLSGVVLWWRRRNHGVFGAARGAASAALVRSRHAGRGSSAFTCRYSAPRSWPCSWRNGSC